MLRRSILVLAASGLLGCGGGGGGGGTPTAPAPSPTPAVSGGPFDLLFTGIAVPHVGQRLYVVVVHDPDGAVVADGYQTIPVDGSFTFSWSEILEGNESYHLDFFADQNGNGVCDAAPVDHTWQEALGTVTGAVSYHFVHHANFADVCAGWP